MEWSGRLSTDRRILIVVKDWRPEQLWILFHHGTKLSHEGEGQEGTWQQIKDASSTGGVARATRRVSLSNVRASTDLVEYRKRI